MATRFPMPEAQTGPPHPGLLEKLLHQVRTGGLDDARMTLTALGVPEPADSGRWSDRNGSVFLVAGQPIYRNANYIRFVTLAAEVYDQFGFKKLAAQCLRSRNLQTEVDRDLEESSSTSNVIDRNIHPDEWRLLRQKLYFWLQIARVAYRENDCEWARTCVQRVLEISKKLDPKSEGLIADAHFRLAAIARQESRLNDAIESYGECLTSAFELLKQQHKCTDPLSPEGTLAARYLIGKSTALGLGYCFIEKGMLREARVAIVSGEILLWETKDRLNLQYCELLFARLLRHQAGRDPQNSGLLDQAREMLQSCMKVCTGHRPRFVYRVHYELGFVDLYSGEFGEAEGNFKKVLKAATDGNDSRWMANATVAMARLRFYQAQAARSEEDSQALLKDSLQLAIKAEAIAATGALRWGRGRAILMQARAEISLAALTLTPTETCRSLRDSAKEHLHTVLQMADLSNPAVRALPVLLLARLGHSEGNSPQARRHLDEWLAMKDQVQYAAIQALGAEVTREIMQQQKFVDIAAMPDDELNKEELVLELERYIFQRLEARKDLTDEEKAHLWGGARTSYLRRRKQVVGF
jgi:hypothetical protein